jgi:hypothetical protein
MKDYILAFTSILENPFIEKGYKELKIVYEKNKKNQEAEDINFLIKNKFNYEPNDPNSSKEQ